MKLTIEKILVAYKIGRIDLDEATRIIKSSKIEELIDPTIVDIKE